jgi:hypothetical protein
MIAPRSFARYPTATGLTVAIISALLAANWVTLASAQAPSKNSGTESDKQGGLPGASELANSVLAGFRNARESVRSGVVVIHEEVAGTYQGQERRRTIEMRIAFDRKANRLRQEARIIEEPEQQNPVDVWTAALKKLGQKHPQDAAEKRLLELKKKKMSAALTRDGANGGPTERRRILVTTPEGKFLWDGIGAIRVFPEGTRAGMDRDLKALELFAIGFYNPRELDSRFSYQEMEEFLQHRLNQHEMTATKEGHLYHLIADYKIKSSTLRRETLVDGSLGFLPLRTKRFVLDPKTGAFGRPDVVSVKWIKYSDVYVPAAVEAVAQVAATRWKLTFDWKSVNAAVSDDEFNYRKFVSAGRTRVLDYRQGADKPVLVEVLGAPTAKQVVAQMADIGNDHRRSRLMMILFANLAVIATVGLALGIRSWRRPR